MGEHDKTDVTEADRLVSAGAETSARPGQDEIGPVSGEAEEQPGTQQPGADPAEAEEIEAERQERLDPDNRPEGAEVDNTDRDFDAEKGMYADSDGYEDAEQRFPPTGEQGA
ncbi:hypothetical protein [Nocardioides dilutus]